MENNMRYNKQLNMLSHAKTRRHEEKVLKRYVLLILCATLLAGCFGGGSKSTHYYLVDPVEQNPIRSVQEGETPLAVEIIDLHLPQYLERFQIVTRNRENQLHLSDANQWGEALRKNLLRTMGTNLAGLLSTIDVGTPLNRSASLPDYRVHIHIIRFEQDSDGRVKLDARWQLGDDSDDQAVMYAVSLQSSSIAEGDYADIVAAMQDLYSQFGLRIAESIVAKEEAQ